MKFKTPIFLLVITLFVASCATLGMPPDPLKNCEQLRVTIDEVKEDIAAKVPYEGWINADNMPEKVVQTAMLALVIPIKELVLTRVDELEELIERYRNLLKYSHEKECGHEFMEAQTLIKTIKSAREKLE